MTRIENLKAMDDIMRNLDDEEYVMWWLEEGVPDGEDEWEWLTEDEYYLDIVDTYNRILSAYTDEYPEEIAETNLPIIEDA